MRISNDRELVILLLFYWQYIGGANLENISIESVLDQVAIPTKIINVFLQKPIRNLPSKKYVANEEVESSTIHYENANGFVPLIVSTQPYELKNNRRNLIQYDAINKTKKNTPKIIKKISIFPEETRIFFTTPNTGENRRSFQIDDNQNEFELLKVNNDTPAVATYNSFIDHSRNNYKSDRSNSEINYGKALRTKDREREKRIQNYMDSYDVAKEDSRQYTRSEVDKNNKYALYQQEKSHHYSKASTASYGTQKTSPQTNYGTITSTMSNIKAFTPKVDKNEEYRFKNPIMVDEKFRRQSLPSTAFTSNHNGDKKDEFDRATLENRESESLSQIEGTSRNYDSAGFRDFSDENLDYMEEMDKPRRVQKTSKRRPYRFDSSRKLPKEHREIYDDTYDDQGRKRANKPKSRQKQKSKPIEVVNEDDPYEKEEQFESDENNRNNQQNFNDGNTWNQVAPNVEVSHSNGYEIDQIEKPKLHIVPVNILSNFDHATALDNSQGFDITNAMFTGFVHEAPLVSTATPLISSSPNYLNRNSIPSSTSTSSMSISTPVPDVIVGQSSFNNPIQAVFMPNKLQQNMLNQYMQSTVSPTLFAVTSRPEFLGSSTISPSLQQILNQVQSSIPINQHIFNAQPTQQTYANLLQPIHSNANNQIYVNTNSDQGQNFYQFKNSQSATSTSNSETNESQQQKFNVNNGQFVASASLSVGNNQHSQTRNKNANKRNNYRINNQNQNKNNNDNIQRNQQKKGQSSSNFIQPTVVPAILHTGIGLFRNQNSQLVQNPLFIANSQSNTPIFKGTNEGLDNSMKQLQYNIKNNRYQLTSISSIDNAGGASNNVNAINNLIDPIQKAQLPLLGATNVEIVNPNLNANAYAINQVPATLVTTPIPMFTTTGFIASKQAFTSTTQEPLGADRALFNPINFVPNYDLIKSQSVLNSNVVPNNQFVQQNLNLVPVVPGGNFYKHSQGAQIDLANKPKLSSDLEKYAEEMFKESLRTIYNSHKWNNDPRSPGNISLVDNSDLAKLRNELLRIKNNIRYSKIPKDVLEAHHTENKFRTSHGQGHGPRTNFNHENSRLRPRQGVVSTKSKGQEPQASTIVDYRYSIRQHHNQPDYQSDQSYNYPTFSTSLPESDHFRSSAAYRSSEGEFYDINHQRTHNLMGLLMKNKQLPPGTQGNYYSDSQAINKAFDEENQRMQSQIRWIIVLFGVSVGSCLTLENNSTATPQNSTTNLSTLNNDLQQSIKPKRQLDEFDFDSSTFDDLPSIFPAKEITSLSTFNDDEIEDISGFIPSASFKVTRSNSESLGTHGENYESLNPPAPNYHSSPQVASQATNSQANLYSNEDSEALSQVRQTETSYNNQVTTPLYIDSYVTHPKYAAAKSSAFPRENQYKVPAKVQFNSYPTLSELAPNVPVYGPIAQVSLHSIVPNNRHQVQQSASQNTGYKAPIAHNFKNIHPTTKVYAPLHAHNQQQQYDAQFQNYAHNPYDNVQYTTTPGLEISNKKLELPVIQLQTAPNYPGYIQTLETTPLIFSSETGLQYKADPGFRLSYEFAKPKSNHPNQRSGTNSPFLGVASPIQVLPVQTASSTAQFPKFKGASIGQFPSRGFKKTDSYFPKNDDDDDDVETLPKKYFKQSELEDEEETQKQEKREKILDREQHGRRKSKGHKGRSKSYADEFEETFRRKPNKLKHSHRHSKVSKASKESNERPRISASYSASKSLKKNRHRAYRDESGEPSSRPSSLSGPTRQTFKRDYRLEESDKPKEDINSKTLPQVVWQDSYGMRVNNPEDEALRSSYSKEESAVIDSYGSTRKPSTTSRQELTTKLPYKSTTLPSQNDDKLGSSTFSPHGSWKSTGINIKPISNESYSKPSGSGLKALVNPKQNYFSPLLGRGEIFRTLKGV
ncbi:hypothetical protein TSAR_004686 [Trichomalopsis sarcophagae]|uniref:Uncharacterized protein n=1 Tax=Trichomalopsis sarcophagae TaxID=543379 RepID=A0A232FF23_9HYME|nr:hypothetical protein TSAR_004686 [Trichomalopsis sarcophagae]